MKGKQWGNSSSIKSANYLYTSCTFYISSLTSSYSLNDLLLGIRVYTTYSPFIFIINYDKYNELFLLMFRAYIFFFHHAPCLYQTIMTSPTKHDTHQHHITPSNIKILCSLKKEIRLLLSTIISVYLFNHINL